LTLLLWGLLVLVGAAVGPPQGWLALAAFLLGCFASSRMAAAGIEWSVRGDAPVTRWLLGGAMVMILLSVVIGVAWSRTYWGYAFSRPTIAEAVRGITRVHRISWVCCAATGTGAACRAEGFAADADLRCRQDPYYCLGERIPVGLQDAGLRPPTLPGVDEADLDRLATVIADPANLVRPDPGYDGNRSLCGTLAAVDWDGASGLIAGLSGQQISDDHYPYYEWWIATEGDRPHVADRTVFFYDVAGVEGAAWWQLSLAIAVMCFTLWGPLCLLIAGVLACWRRFAGGGARSPFEPPA
jgi:hypothetical protein